MTLEELKRLMLRVPGEYPIAHAALQWRTFYKRLFRRYPKGFSYVKDADGINRIVPNA